ncbi:hypothetical protein [Methylobacterium gnaphalii]|uniref:Uncharacterized protein n=1 Tax=Methylobacterium gnaphalii TaxID=1010610 RepID=A0A512JP22_9HYPH|nr:hypothetical protein [Methylobacterium gnaphalii]GEP11700.1 hypothetical protein MGN01_35450 [Methylobacterium gnaphalii]GJD68785.1 hypothetical protein MMMDOFMJ_1709 [Methylobacterium gnaphalii]GLS50197.1 hypothetical protein GCM10007885_30490 [Methylobacterium gnaphalii]
MTASPDPKDALREALIEFWVSQMAIFSPEAEAKMRADFARQADRLIAGPLAPALATIAALRAAIQEVRTTVAEADQTPRVDWKGRRAHILDLTRAALNPGGSDASNG